MALIIHIDNSNPQERKQGQAVKLTRPPLSAPDLVRVREFCPCYIECEYEELALYGNGSDLYENDSTSFLTAKQLAADTVTYSLYKNGVKAVDLDSNANGVLYDGFDSQPLYYGYVIDWQKVASNYGNGRYTVKTAIDILGNTAEIESRVFRVMPFSELIADGTVKIESYQTGNILGSDIDYTGLLPNGWYQSLRIQGIFGKKTPDFVKDSYISENYADTQIQTQIEPEYLLESGYMPAETANQLFYGDITGNKLLISDYNLISSEVLDRINVTPVKFNSAEHSRLSVKQSWTFRKSTQNNLKTNY